VNRLFAAYATLVAGLATHAIGAPLDPGVAASSALSSQSAASTTATIRTDDTKDNVAESSQAVSVPIFCEQWFHVTRGRDITKGRMTAVDRHDCVMRWGSVFAYGVGDQVLLVTAAHVVPPPGKIGELKLSDGTVFSAKEDYVIEGSECRVRIGGLSVVPKRWIRDPDMDVVLYELDAKDLATLNLEVLRAGPVKRNDEVKLWGFPGVARKAPDGTPEPMVPSASQTSQRVDVTDVRPGEVVCAPLNGVETRGGFSGGPVLNSKDLVVGMIMRSTAENTRCRSMQSIDKLASAFAPTGGKKDGNSEAKPAASPAKVVEYKDPPRPKV
jgi:S1-C subfamily serine protease